MAKATQLNIIVQNRPGTVAELARALGEAKVNIVALMAWGEGPTGTACLVVDNARRAKAALAGAGLAATETTVQLVELANKPGALAQCLERLAAKGVNLSAIYGTVSKGGRKASIVLVS